MSDPGDLLLTTKRFSVLRMTTTQRDGSQHTREVIRHPGAVAILPLVEDQQVCLIRNHRVAVGQTLIELPAGTLEPQEDPKITARRELLEETGYRAEHLRLLTTFYMSPGILDERMHVFLASGLEPGPASREPGEQIENLVVPWSDAITMVHDGTIQDAKTIVGLLFYDRWMNHARSST